MANKIKLSTPLKVKGKDITEVELTRQVTAGDFIDVDLPGRGSSELDARLLELVTGIPYEDIRRLSIADFQALRGEMADLSLAVES